MFLEKISVISFSVRFLETQPNMNYYFFVLIIIYFKLIDQNVKYNFWKVLFQKIIYFQDREFIKACST